jgi:hypothetical protein
MADPITDGKIDTACRCCGIALRVPEEDALDLCAVCLRGKGGDTNEPCAIHDLITLTERTQRIHDAEEHAGCPVCQAEVERLREGVEARNAALMQHVLTHGWLKGAFCDCADCTVARTLVSARALLGERGEKP